MTKFHRVHLSMDECMRRWPATSTRQARDHGYDVFSARRRGWLTNVSDGLRPCINAEKSVLCTGDLCQLCAGMPATEVL